MEVMLLCSVQNFKMIELLKRMLRTNGVLWELSLICILDGYPTLHSPLPHRLPTYCWNAALSPRCPCRFLLILLASSLYKLENDTSAVNFIHHKLVSVWYTEASGVRVCSEYSISEEICTRFCCALLCCGYAIVHNEFTWSIYPYSSGLLCWPQCQCSKPDGYGKISQCITTTKHSKAKTVCIFLRIYYTYPYVYQVGPSFTKR